MAISSPLWQQERLLWDPLGFTLMGVAYGVPL